MKTIVLMPTFNEAKSIGETVQSLRNQNLKVDLLIIDDASPDGTGKIADALVDTNTFVLHRTRKAGLGAAYVSGFSWALERGYELIVEMDADGSHRAEDLSKIISAAANAELVLGSRWVSGGSVVGWPVHRQLISRIGNLYARIMLRTKISDMTSGFRAYRASLLQSLELSKVSARGYAFQVEMALLAARAKSRVVEVPITFVERAHGNSKMTTAIVLEALWLVTKWAFYRSA
jgi:glycosyltransferase involved in cell wall biosynthesis